MCVDLLEAGVRGAGWAPSGIGEGSITCTSNNRIEILLFLRPFTSGRMMYTSIYYCKYHISSYQCNVFFSMNSSAI